MFFVEPGIASGEGALMPNGFLPLVVKSWLAFALIFGSLIDGDEVELFNYPVFSELGVMRNSRDVYTLWCL
jgi:hypothetical protein